MSLSCSVWSVFGTLVVLVIAHLTLLHRWQSALPSRSSHVQSSQVTLRVVLATFFSFLLFVSGGVTVLLVKKRWGRFHYVVKDLDTDRTIPTRHFLVALWLVTLVLMATLAWVFVRPNSILALRHEERRTWVIVGLVTLTSLLLLVFLGFFVSRIHKKRFWEDAFSTSDQGADAIYDVAQSFCNATTEADRRGIIDDWWYANAPQRRMTTRQQDVDDWVMFLDMVIANDRRQAACLDAAVRATPAAVLVALDLGTTQTRGKTDAKMLLPVVETVSDAFCRENDKKPLQEWLFGERHRHSVSEKWALFFKSIIIHPERQDCIEMALTEMPPNVDIYIVEQFLKEVKELSSQQHQDLIKTLVERRFAIVRAQAAELAAAFCQTDGTMEKVYEWFTRTEGVIKKAFLWTYFFEAVLIKGGEECADKALLHMPSDIDLLDIPFIWNDKENFIAPESKDKHGAYVENLQERRAFLEQKWKQQHREFDV